MPSYAPWYEYAIAAGWNNPALLKALESITPVGDKPFRPPNAYSAFNPGTLRLRADGIAYVEGFASTTWTLSVMTRAQYRYLMANYTIGGNSYSGKVTIKTMTPAGTYTNYNAIMLLPIMPDLDRAFKIYRNVQIKFIRLATPS